MITITFQSNNEILLNRLRSRFEAIIGRTEQTMTDEMDRLQAYIVNNKLSGQVLMRRTGNLARSVKRLPTIAAGTLVTGGVQAGGGTAFYAGIHEYGGTRSYKIYPVNKKALAFFPSVISNVTENRSAIRSIQRGLKKEGSVRARAINRFREMGGVTVKSVTHPPLPIRSFMRSSLEERTSAITDSFRKAIVEELRR